MRNKELKKKLGQLQEKIAKASLPISADLSNDCKSSLETIQRKKITLLEVNFGGAAKISTLFYQ